jgi:hypothetical protein
LHGGDELDPGVLEPPLSEEGVGFRGELLRPGIPRDHEEGALLVLLLLLDGVLVDLHMGASPLPQLGVVTLAEVRATEHAVGLDGTLEDDGRRGGDLRAVIHEAIGVAA